MAGKISPNPNRVALTEQRDYNPARVKEAIITLLQPLGGLEAFVSTGQKVLLKPNLLAGRSPDKAVTTHPAVVRAIIELCLDLGANVSLGDSPGIGSLESVANKAGLLDIVKTTGIKLATFEKSVPLTSTTGTFHKLEVAQDILDAEVVINLPKLKTHQMMGMTCAVKNMFGAVVGLRKPRLHLQAGTDKAFFALMLLELCELLSPTLSIVDAIVGMEGEGPGSGDPVAIGALIAGTNCQAIDTVATEMLGLETAAVWTQQQARLTGRPYTRLSDLELIGTPLDELKVVNFKPAKMTDINFGLKGNLKRYLKNSLSARPEASPEQCKLCNECVKLCPPQAMKIKNQRLKIDYDLCIRCFCCQELCPHGALHTTQGLLLKLYTMFKGK